LQVQRHKGTKGHRELEDPRRKAKIERLFLEFNLIIS